MIEDLPTFGFPTMATLGRVILFLVSACLREMCHDLIQQIAQSQTGSRRDRYRITDTEVVELIDVIAKFRRSCLLY